MSVYPKLLRVGVILILPFFSLVVSFQLRQDGQPDQRLSSEHGFGGDRQAASEQVGGGPSSDRSKADQDLLQGKKGGSTQPDSVYKPSEHGGRKSPRCTVLLDGERKLTTPAFPTDSQGGRHTRQAHEL